jgi:hypothetical protein
VQDEILTTDLLSNERKAFEFPVGKRANCRRNPRFGFTTSSGALIRWSMQNYEWLLFDADGTLFDYERAKGTDLIEVFQSIRGRRADMRT